MSLAHTRRALAAGICIFPLAVTAQNPGNSVQKLDNIVVTASRTSEALRDVVGDVTVIDQQQLQAAGKDSVAEILSRQPGMQFSSAGGPQTATGIFLRGAETKHTLILIDGVRANGSTTGGMQFPALDSSQIERIEILRGAASSLYGSDAIGGVINIITKKGEQDRPLSAWANIGYGSYETAKSSMGVSGASDGWDYSVSTSAASSKGFDATRRLKTDNSTNFSHYPDKDGYRSHAVSGTLGYNWTEGHRIGLTAYNGYIDGDYDGSDDFGNPITDAHAVVRQQAYRLTSTDRITDWWDSELNFGFSKDTYDDRAYQSFISSLKRSYSWTNTLQLQPDHRVSLLLERLEERVGSTTEYDQTARNTNAAALIYQGRIDRLHTQASVRNDNISGHGNQTTGSLGLDFDLTDEWQIGLAGSTGFHMPTFNEMYWPYQSFGGWGSFVGNPNLKPEESRGIEAHISYQATATRLSLVAYQNKIKNLIDSGACDATFNCTTQNINQATIRGLTLTGEHDFGDTTLRASADFLDPRNDQPVQGVSGSQLQMRARQVFHLGVEHRIQALKLGAEYQYTGGRYGDTANNIQLGGFALVNLTAAYDINKSLGVQVRWNNVLDKDYILVDNGISAYNPPGSNVFVNLSWRM